MFLPLSLNTISVKTRAARKPWWARAFGVALAFLRLALLQWDFQLGGASAGGKVALGPLGGVGSGPGVEDMLEAMDSWSGLCLQYRYLDCEANQNQSSISVCQSSSPLLPGALSKP